MKKVEANAHKNTMPTAAYAQKLANAGRLEEAEIPNATKSVMDVTVMEAPARANALAARFVIAVLSSDFLGTLRSRLNALTVERKRSCKYDY